jgi:hypothetical protein
MNAQATISLIVCNLFIVVPFLYRMYRDAQDIEATDKQGGASGPTRKTAASTGHSLAPTTYVLTEVLTQYTYSTTKEQSSYVSTNNFFLLLSTESQELERYQM